MSFDWIAWHLNQSWDPLKDPRLTKQKRNMARQMAIILDELENPSGKTLDELFKEQNCAQIWE